MSARLHIRRVDPERPAAAAEAIARDIGAAAPHGRDVCVLSVPRGDAPGWAVAPWTEVGVRRAQQDAEVRVETLPAAGQPRPPARTIEGDAVSLSWPGVARALRVPSSWLGRRVVLLTPCVVAVNDRRVPLRHGPVAAAFEALAIAVGAPATGDPSGLGARIAAHLFAHVAVIVDASWSVVVDPRAGIERPDSRFATQRCVGLQAPCPTANGHAVRVHEIDAWLVRRLGLTAPGGAPALALHGDADDSRWISVPTVPETLADREVAALWRAPSPHRPARAAVRPRHLDPLERAWEAWTERPS